MQSSSSLGSAGGRSPRIPRSPLNGSRNFDAERRGQGHKSSEDEESLHEYNRDMAVDEYHEVNDLDPSIGIQQACVLMFSAIVRAILRES